ncbi:hypothetical protein LINPERPRIM_LOCUS17269 [Linum perenne]
MSVFSTEARQKEGEVKLGSKSFAEVLAPKVYRNEGRCLLVKEKEECFISVSDVGVEDRLRFLKLGLVFRLDALDGSLPDWKCFREWVNRCWGVPGWAEIRALSDDLWFLVCESEKEVERILRLGMWLFPGHRVRADRWLPSSGTSEVVRNRGWIWVKVEKIPAHLDLLFDLNAMLDDPINEGHSTADPIIACSQATMDITDGLGNHGY